MNVAVTQIITDDVNDVRLVREHGWYKRETNEPLADMFCHLKFLNPE